MDINELLKFTFLNPINFKFIDKLFNFTYMILPANLDNNNFIKIKIIYSGKNNIFIIKKIN